MKSIASNRVGAVGGTRRWRDGLRALFLLGLGLLLPAGGFARAAETLKDDEVVVLYPALARPDGDRWDVDVHGIVYEPERQTLLTSVMRRALGLDEDEMTAAERAIWRERSRYFLVDNERGKQLELRLAGRRFALGTSAANGHFQGTLRLAAAELPGGGPGQAGTGVTWRCELGSPGRPGRSVAMPVLFLADTGVSVISDIDDTIKVSEVLDRDALLRNTFCRPFQPVPGLAPVYRRWADGGAQFHYLTASPWQLYLPLSEFVRSNGFPAGTFHMKNFRLKDGSFTSLFQSPERYKPQVIEELLRRFPRRRFVLVGDSGEKDPEIYGGVARQHPERVEGILIRDVTGDAPGGARYRKAFEKVPAERWQVFKDPAAIQLQPATAKPPAR